MPKKQAKQKTVAGYTYIRLTKSTQDALLKYSRKDMTWDDILNHMINMLNKQAKP